MMRKIFIIIFLLFSNFVRAETNQTYFVDDIKVNKIDKDATTAREKAIFEAQREGFNTVLERIGIDRSNGILISNEEISQTLRSIQIKNEKISDNSYSAVLSMEFSPEFIKFILNKYNVNKFSGITTSYLIIPILNENGQTFLWEKGNRWTYAFKKNLVDNKNIYLVENDFSSRNALDIDFFDKPKFSKFEDIANIYNVNNIVLVIGNYNKGGDIITTKIYVLNKKETRNASLNYQIKNLNNVFLDFAEASNKVISYLDNLKEKDREANNTISTSSDKLTDRDLTKVFVPISSLDDFNSADNLLKNNKNVLEAYLKVLSKNMATYLVKIYNNDTDTFISSLKNDGFSVNEKEEGIYIFLK